MVCVRISVICSIGQVLKGATQEPCCIMHAAALSHEMRTLFGAGVGFGPRCPGDIPSKPPSFVGVSRRLMQLLRLYAKLENGFWIHKLLK